VGAFCAHCGQKAAHLNPSLPEFLHEFFHELVHVDGRIVQTIRLLMTKPGLLSREHFAGRRARYISPIRLYLLFSILYFAVQALGLSGWNVRCDTCPAEQRELVQEQMQTALNVWAPRTLFVLVPAFAALIAIAARRSQRNYPQHLYFAMHVHAAWFFAAAIAALSSFLPYAQARKLASDVVVVYAGVYLVLAFRRTYQTTWRSAIVRGSLVGIVYFGLVLATLLVVVLPVVLREF
jgi:hypothetical protein